MIIIVTSMFSQLARFDFCIIGNRKKCSPLLHNKKQCELSCYIAIRYGSLKIVHFNYVQVCMFMCSALVCALSGEVRSIPWKWSYGHLWATQCGCQDQFLASGHLQEHNVLLTDQVCNLYIVSSYYHYFLCPFSLMYSYNSNSFANECLFYNFFMNVLEYKNIISLLEHLLTSDSIFNLKVEIIHDFKNTYFKLAFGSQVRQQIPIVLTLERVRQESHGVSLSCNVW